MNFPFKFNENKTLSFTHESYWHLPDLSSRLFKKTCQLNHVRQQQQQQQQHQYVEIRIDDMIVSASGVHPLYLLLGCLMHEI